MKITPKIKSRVKPTKPYLLCLFVCIIYSCFFQSLAHANETDHSAVSNTTIPQKHNHIYKAALDGSAEAQYQIGLLFEYGRDVEQDDFIAANWYEKSAAQAFSDAQYRLAILYDNGWGKPTNKEKAFELYESAAENGHELAQHDVAIMYFKGIGVNRNPLQAYKWLRIAVLSGSPLMQKHLTMIAQDLFPEEIKVAESLAKEWMEGTSI